MIPMAKIVTTTKRSNRALAYSLIGLFCISSAIFGPLAIYEGVKAEKDGETSWKARAGIAIGVIETLAITIFALFSGWGIIVLFGIWFLMLLVMILINVAK